MGNMQIKIVAHAVRLNLAYILPEIINAANTSEHPSAAESAYILRSILKSPAPGPGSEASNNKPVISTHQPIIAKSGGRHNFKN